jgi:hypothetical protein
MTEQSDERWRFEYERRMENVEDRMDRHEIQCSERYKALADTLIAAGQARNELREDVKKVRDDVREDVGQIRATLSKQFNILLIALILIAFAAVFQESTIIEFVRHGARAFFDVSPHSTAQ